MAQQYYTYTDRPHQAFERYLQCTWTALRGIITVLKVLKARWPRPPTPAFTALLTEFDRCSPPCMCAQVTRMYTAVRKTHNQGVFDAYTGP